LPHSTSTSTIPIFTGVIRGHQRYSPSQKLVIDLPRHIKYLNSQTASISSPEIPPLLRLNGNIGAMALTRRDMLITAGEDLTGYAFNNDELLWEAVQAPGSNAAFLYPEGNKRLAMIGDSVLKPIILDDLRPRNMTIGKDKHRYSVRCPHILWVHILK
jgi:hypothetical protein